MRYRAVYWISFPILGVLLFFQKQLYVGFTDSLVEAGYSILFFAIQVLLLWVYFAIKNKRPIDITKEYLGLGDLLFLLAIAFYLSPLNYVLFYIGSLVIVLVYALFLQMWLKKSNLQIPLAGLQAFMFAVILLLSIVNPNLKLYSDFWFNGI
jgi:uncharacterized membrane protein